MTVISHVMCIGIGIGVTGCSHWVREVTEMPAGACAQKQKQDGGSCERTNIDHAVTASVSSPTQRRSEVGANVSYRWRAVEVVLDERRVHRSTDPVDPNGYHSIAAGADLHLSPLVYWPTVFRYLDLAGIVGADLGVMSFDGVIRGRADFYLGAALEVTLPDLGPLRYLDGGVPAVRLGIRRTSYVQGWSTATALEIGLLWRWGTPIDIHAKTVYRMSLD